MLGEGPRRTCSNDDRMTLNPHAATLPAATRVVLRERLYNVLVTRTCSPSMSVIRTTTATVVSFFGASSAYLPAT